MGLLNMTDDQAMALGLLGSAMMQGNAGAGFGSALQYMGGAQERATNAQYKQMQMQEIQSQIAARQEQMRRAQQQAAFDQQFMGGGAPGGAQPAGMPGAAPAGSPLNGGGLTAQQISQQYGIPLEAVIMDYRTNGGKKIAELIDSRSKPNWQNINGNLVNTNAPGFQGGFQPGVNVSNDGRATMWQPDGRGGLVVGAPTGAMDTYRAYQNIGEQTRANFDPLTITPPDGRPVMSTRGNVVREINQPQLPAPQSGVNGAFVGDPAQVAATIAQIRDPQERANAQAAFEAQMRQSGGRLGIPLQSEAEAAGAKERAVKGAAAEVDRQTGKTKKADSANDMLGNIWRARVLLESDPTGSLAGAGVDKLLGAFGKSTPSAQNADRLESISGWLVNNVPRMEGPQSNFDVENYKTMAGRVGDRTYPVAGRLAALEEIERIQKKYAAGGSTTSNASSAKPLPPNPKPAMLTRGESYQLPNGKVGVWDGMGFKVQ